MIFYFNTTNKTNWFDNDLFILGLVLIEPLVVFIQKTK